MYLPKYNKTESVGHKLYDKEFGAYLLLSLYTMYIVHLKERTLNWPIVFLLAAIVSLSF